MKARMIEISLQEEFHCVLSRRRRHPFFYKPRHDWLINSQNRLTASSYAQLFLYTLRVSIFPIELTKRELRHTPEFKMIVFIAQ